MAINTSYSVPMRVRPVGSIGQLAQYETATAPQAPAVRTPAPTVANPVTSYPAPQPPAAPVAPYLPAQPVARVPQQAPAVPTLPTVPSPAGRGSFVSDLFSGLKDGAKADVNFVFHPIRSAKNLLHPGTDPTTFIGALRSGHPGRALGHAVSVVAGAGLALVGGRFLLGKLGFSGGASVGTGSSGFLGSLGNAVGSVFHGIGAVVGGVFHGIGRVFGWLFHGGGASVGYR